MLVFFLNPTTEISTHSPLAGRDGNCGIPAVMNVISTHSPSRGVTLAIAAAVGLFLYFNSHALAGRDVILRHKTTLKTKFQLTRPRGA